MIIPALKRAIEDNGHPHDMVSFADSVLDALQEEVKEALPAVKSNNMRLIEMEIEKNKLCDKIAELKDKHLHMRSVILQLLKSLELK